MPLTIKSSSECKYDLISLGEVMLRFDPGDNRIRATRHFQVWEGGGEYNTAKGLSTCFGKRTAVVTSFVDNELGKLLASLIRSGGVDPSLIVWREDDGIGKSCRNGIYFLERGYGQRPAKGCSDRANSAISQLKPGDIDWETVFGSSGTRWFHTGGIYAGLSDSAPEVILEAVQSAKKHGIIVSYDLNYRDSLWKNRGGKPAADRLNRQLIEHADVVFGIESLDRAPIGLEESVFADALEKMSNIYPHLQCIVTTMRDVKSASRNSWSGMLWLDGKLHKGPKFEDLEIFDRVGGGDAFAAGIIHGFLESFTPEKSLAYGIAHGALAMSTPGDTSMATEDEVSALLATGDAAVIR